MEIHVKEGYAWRFNVAMAEAGYTDRLFLDGVGRLLGPAADVPWAPAPPAVVWQALFLAKNGDPHPCWSCWDAANRAHPLGPDWERGRWASDCVTGKRGGCHFPNGPAKPPRELLVSRPTGGRQDHLVWRDPGDG